MGGNLSTGSFICQKTPGQKCSCRHHMRYTRGVELKGDAYDRLAELQIDKVAVQKDILLKQLGEAATDLEREHIQEELDTIDGRRESDRSEEADWAKRTCLTSGEWGEV